ncbi:SDR family NAD(P)-dependent oxidoreductase [Microbacterium sp.]|uniref:SDR family NAD(P)-dependent oxidoreductase n=1 Tax=Microbacterium sp. TaxID=51671 RepID=UPI00333E959C
MTGEPRRPRDERRHVLLTGGCGGIGRVIAAALLRAGYAVTLSDQRPQEQGDAAAAALRDAVAGAEVSYSPADVRDPDAVAALVAGMPRIDVAIANAAIGRSAPILDLTHEEWQAHLDANLTGAFLTGQAAARRMAAEGTEGLLLFTSSWIAQIPWPEMTAYAATKAGIEMLMKQFARELGPRGIRANAIAPGIVAAGMAQHQLDTEPDYAARASRVVPLGRLQTAESVADAVVYLCSPQASYMTGTTLTIDGGSSLFAFD